MSVSKPPALRLSHVGFSYGSQTVLQDISIEVPHGKYIGIIGPNGGGKTTLLRLILGLLTPTSGTVEVLGVSPKDACRSGKVGYVPRRIAHTPLTCPATVEEVVRSGRSAKRGLFSRFTSHDHHRIEVALSDAGIVDLRYRQIADLSGGERQKVFIARALAADPDLLILDEPTTGIDTPSEEAFFSYISHLHRDHDLTIMLVLHDVTVVAREVQSVLCLNRTLLCAGSPQSVLEEGKLQQLYGAHAALIPHAHHHA